MAKPKAGSHVIMLGKLISGAVGSRIAESAGKSGALGAAAGVVASRIIKRSPAGAVIVGGAWLAHKLWKRSKERAESAAALAAKPARRVEPHNPTPKAPRI